MFVEVLREKGIEPNNASTGCIPDSGLPQFAAGYNSVADPLLQAKFGTAYMALMKKEVVHRMQGFPQPAR